jgi:hypothetical protein
MHFFVKKISIGYLEYLIWILCEITILAGFYIFIAHKVGFIDNYIQKNPGLVYWEATFEIFRKAVANTTWMLLIPYVISFLYLYNEHLIKKLAENTEENKENNVIQFKDEKDEVRFSITSDKVVFIESSDNYCIIKYLNNDKISDFVLRSSLKRLANELIDTPIQRCHRSYMINLEHVASLKKDNSDISFEFDVPNVKEIPISKSYNEKIMELFVIHSKQK